MAITIAIYCIKNLSMLRQQRIVINIFMYNTRTLASNERDLTARKKKKILQFVIKHDCIRRFVACKNNELRGLPKYLHKRPTVGFITVFGNIISLHTISLRNCFITFASCSYSFCCYVLEIKHSVVCTFRFHFLLKILWQVPEILFEQALAY